MTTKKSGANFCDAIRDKLGLSSDAALSRALNVAPPRISKLRNGRISIGPCLLLDAHEMSGIAIRELKALAGMPAYVKNF